MSGEPGSDLKGHRCRDGRRSGVADPAVGDVYPVVFLDALVLKIRDGGTVQRKACYLALGIGLDGDREVLGMWFQDTEGAKTFL